MLEYIFFAISTAIFAISAGIAVFTSWRPSKKNFSVSPFYIFAVGVFLSATALFIPFNFALLGNNALSNFTTLLVSFHSTIRLFIVDCDFNSVIEETKSFTPALQNHYIILLSVLYVTAPAMTIGVVLSFFKNLSAYNRYLMGYWKDVYIFSELNEHSIALAESLRENEKKKKIKARQIIFTDVFIKNEEDSYEFIDRAKKISAICFKKDIASINFRLHSKKTRMYFFVMGEDETENINHTIKLSKPYVRTGPFSSKKSEDTNGYDIPRKDTRIYVFSHSTTSEKYLSALETNYIRIRHVNNVQSLVYNILYDTGMDIFNFAKPTGEKIYNSATGQYDDEKKISALVIGAGLYGTEMIRALTWMAQMHPYKLEINAFDKEKHAADYLQSICPDMFDCNPAFKTKTKKNGKTQKFHNGDYDTPGEAHYKISIFSGFDAELSGFDKKISKFTDTTYVFVALGDDDLNVQISTKVRVLLQREGVQPLIHTVVHKHSSFHTLTHAQTYSGHAYNVIPFGDVANTYSEEHILHSELEKKALSRHMNYVNHLIEKSNIQGEEREEMLRREEETFWKFDYNYRSSIAAAIHAELKRGCHIPGCEKPPAERTPEERSFIQRMEHQRWNAYVRSEGYVYRPTRDKLAKTHNLLIPFDELPYEEQIKDDD